jgi:hypothetical protein
MRKHAHVPSNGDRVDHLEGASVGHIAAPGLHLPFNIAHVAARSKRMAQVEMTRR